MGLWAWEVGGCTPSSVGLVGEILRGIVVVGRLGAVGWRIVSAPRQCR